MGVRTAKSLMKLVVLGPPGSGKGTISSWIARDFGLKYLCCGDILRREISAKSEIGLQAQQYIKDGKLVPDELVTNLTLDELSEKYANSSWLLDGFPRTVVQAQRLSKYSQPTKVVNLIVPDEEIINRIKDRVIHLTSGRVYNLKYNPPKVPGVDDITGEKLVQREDDKPETVKKRLLSYANQTRPVLEYYRQSKLLVEFTGTRSDEIYPLVKNYLQSIS